MDIKEYRREYYKKNKAKILKKSRINHKLNRVKRIKRASERYYSKDSLPRIIFSRAKQRAKEKGINFDITIDDIIIPELCPILKIKLNRSFGGKAQPNSPSLDKIVPNLGYTKGNVQIISYKANTMKNNATLEELIKFTEYVNDLRRKKK